MKPPFIALALGWALAGAALAQTEPGRSLYERRLNIIKGESPGIVVIEAPSPKAAASAASAASSPGASSVAGTAPAAPAASAPTSWLGRLGAALGMGEAASGGAPMNATRRLEASPGIALPTAATAAATAAAATAAAAPASQASAPR